MIGTIKRIGATGEQDELRGQPLKLPGCSRIAQELRELLHSVDRGQVSDLDIDAQ